MPAADPVDTSFAAVRRRMTQRDGIDSLPDHLRQVHGIAATKCTSLDVGVFRVDRSDGPPVVARVFAADRPHQAVLGDLAVLSELERQHFPAERPFGETPLSEYAGQSVLLTGWVTAASKAEQPPYPVVRLGARIGRLNGLAMPAGVRRPAGALHHHVEGTLADELHAAAGWLDSVPDSAAVNTLRTALSEADGGDGLPAALVHPDPVPKNAIFTADGPVLVDWAAAGRGPRLAALTLVLRSTWAARPFLRGYARHVTLTEEERDRLSGLLISRALVSRVFRVCLDPSSAPAAAAKLSALRRATDQHAQQLLDALAGWS